MAERVVLLTGATGFVGRNLLLHEIARGSRILAVVRDAEKLRSQLAFEGLNNAAVETLPTDPALWPRIEPTHAVLAAGVLFGRTEADYRSVNVDWTLQILAAIPKTCATVVLSSQSAGGPTPPGLPSRREEHEDQPVTWYGRSKLALEREIHTTGRQLAVLRPPMILGPRDSATLPLFRMAAGRLRPKPGLQTKMFSFLDVRDLLTAIDASWESGFSGAAYVASNELLSDADLVAAAAALVGVEGVSLPIPHLAIRAASLLIDAVPSLREANPSLTRDRVREILHDRWVVSPARFEQSTGWRAKHSAREALAEACAFYRREGRLPSRC